MSDQTALWRAVIGQAFADAASNAKTGVSPLERRRARHWLTTPSADFNEVCTLAGLEPQAVRAFALKHIAEADNREAQPKPKPAPKPANVKQWERLYTDRHGVSLTLPEWAERIGISKHTLRSRLQTGWPLDQALTTPLSRPGGHRSQHQSADARKPSFGRPSKTYSHNGQSLTTKEWAKVLNVKYAALWHRLRTMPVAEALNIPRQESSNRPRGKTTPWNDGVGGHLEYFANELMTGPASPLAENPEPDFFPTRDRDHADPA